MKFEEYVNSLEGRLDGWKIYMATERYRFRHVIDSMPSCTSQIRVLDIGTSPFTLFIKRMYPHYEVSTLDFSDYWEDSCKEAGIKFRMCDLEKQPLPFEDDYFDLVIFTEVLEHLSAPPSKVLREVRRVMRVKGKMILSVPNIAALRHRLKLLLGISPLKDLDNPHDHVHEYTMREIISKLKICGFTVSQKKYLQPSVTHALSEFRERHLLALVYAAYYATGLLLLVPSLRVAIFIECYKTIDGDNRS